VVEEERVMMTTMVPLRESKWVGVFVSATERPLALFSADYALDEASRFAVLWALDHLIHYEIRDVTLGPCGMVVSPDYPPIKVNELPCAKKDGR
jgi:hypothetical protein